MTLHTVNKSPFGSSALSNCLRTVSQGDALLLIEDGVYGADSHQQDCWGPAPEGVQLFALKADVEARGLTGRVSDKVTLIDDGQFVDLVVDCDKSQSWY